MASGSRRAECSQLPLQLRCKSAAAHDAPARPFQVEVNERSWCPRVVPRPARGMGCGINQRSPQPWAVHLTGTDPRRAGACSFPASVAPARRAARSIERPNLAALCRATACSPTGPDARETITEQTAGRGFAEARSAPDPESVQCERIGRGSPYDTEPRLTPAARDQRACGQLRGSAPQAEDKPGAMRGGPAAVAASG